MKRVSKFFLYSLYAVIFGEVFIRLMAPVAIVPRYVTDMPYGIRGNQPNKSYWQKSPEYKVQVTTNSKGIRSNREIPYEKPNGIYRIVLLGDSFTMGFEVAHEDSYAYLLEKYLNDVYGRKVEVINLATSGHGNAEELITLQHEGLKYSPDLVLLCWHNTDINDNLRSGLFELTDDGLERAATSYLPGVKVRETLFSIPFYSFIAETSHLYNFAREYIAYRLKDILSQLKDKERPQETDEKTESSYAVNLTLSLLDEIKRTSNANSAAFAIFDIPSRKRDNTSQSNFPIPYEEAKSRYSIINPVDILDENANKKLYYVDYHRHFTPYASNLVATLLAEEIDQIIEKQ